VKDFPVNTVEHVDRFTRLTTTDVLANKTAPAKIARLGMLSYLRLSVNST